MVYGEWYHGGGREETRQRHRGLKGKSMSQRRSQRGIALIWAAIVIFVMVGIVGLSVDWGKLALNVGQMQNAGDAAALAGAQVVKFDPEGAITRAHDYGLANYAETLPVTLSMAHQPEPFSGTEDGLDIILGRWVRQNHEFFPTLDAPNAVKVIVRRREGLTAETPALSLVFGPAFGTNTVSATRDTVAWCFDYSGAALICLSEDADPGLKVWGNGKIDVENGGIHVNSAVTTAAKAGGSALIDCGQMNVVGGTQPAPDGDWDKYMVQPFSVNTNETMGVQPIADPVAAAMGGINELDLPKDASGKYIYGTIRNPDGTTTTAGSATIQTSCTLGPGYYPGGIRMTGGPTITLDPTLGWNPAMGQAIYFLGGVGLYLNNGTLTGHGVTIYITEDSTAKLDFQGNVTLDITSPGDEAGTSVDGMPGIGLWVDPDNPNAVTLNGCSGEGVQGTMYFPGSHVDCEGTPGKGAPQIICASMDVTGDLNVGVNYDQRNSGIRSYRSFIVK